MLLLFAPPRALAQQRPSPNIHDALLSSAWWWLLRPPRLLTRTSMPGLPYPPYPSTTNFLSSGWHSRASAPRYCGRPHPHHAAFSIYLTVANLAALPPTLDLDERTNITHRRWRREDCAANLTTTPDLCLHRMNSAGAAGAAVPTHLPRQPIPAVAGAARLHLPHPLVPLVHLCTTTCRASWILADLSLA